MVHVATEVAMVDEEGSKTLKFRYHAYIVRYTNK